MAGMKDTTKKLIKADRECVWHPFTQMAGWVDSEPVIIDSADGFYLIDTEGKVVYHGGLGPFDFFPAKLKKAIDGYLEKSEVQI